MMLTFAVQPNGATHSFHDEFGKCQSKPSTYFLTNQLPPSKVFDSNFFVTSEFSGEGIVTLDIRLE